jgi:hypothetical protein
MDNRAKFLLFVSGSAVMLVLSCNDETGPITPSDVTGTWHGTWQSQVYNQIGSFSAELEQYGEALYGTIDIPDLAINEDDLTGTVTGSSITFGDIGRRITFSGEISGVSSAYGTYSYPATDDHGIWQASMGQSFVFEVVDEIDAPGMMPSGLAYDGQDLWVAVAGAVPLHRIDTSGFVLESITPTPSVSLTGLTFDGTSLWASSVGDGTIYRLDIAGIIVESYDAPGLYPWGLAFDGSHLWTCDGGTQKIYKLTTTGTFVASFDSPGESPHGLTYDGIYLWNSDFESGRIFQLTTDGGIVAVFSAPGTRPSGLTYDGTYLWNADWTNGKIYKIRIN